MPGYPPNWYKYNAHYSDQKSKADYSPENVAWFIEGLAASFGGNYGVNHTGIVLKYDDGTVAHPNDKLYYNDKIPSQPSQEWLYYVQKAKQSKRLKLFEQFAPGGATYFQDPTVVVRAQALVETISLSPKISEIHQSVYAYDKASYITAPTSITFEQLPVDAPEVYNNLTLKWVDKGEGSGSVVLDIGGDEGKHDYRLTKGCTYHQWTWEGKVSKRADINLATVVYEGQHLTAMELEVCALSQL